MVVKKKPTGIWKYFETKLFLEIVLLVAYIWHAGNEWNDYDRLLIYKFNIIYFIIKINFFYYNFS